MTYHTASRYLAWVCFLVALVTYTLTLQPSVPFWDCGEFSAAAVWQQVPHPPGAPLFLLVARIFHLLPIGDPGWRINMVSAVASAATASLVFLIVLGLIERWRPVDNRRSASGSVGALGGALVGALAFTWSDTNWFNAVESEVYATGNLLIALLIWLMIKWDREADTPGHERYLLLMAYLIGLAIGVHLLALLVYPAIALVVYFRTQTFKPLTFAALVAITALTFWFLVYKAPLSFIPSLFEFNAVVGLAFFLLLVGVAVYAMREKKSILYLATTSFLLIILGYTTYTQILIRSASHPPMNENSPDTFGELVDYLGRKQYGTAPDWPRRYRTERQYTDYQLRYDSGTGDNWQRPVLDPATNEPVFEHINTKGELNFMWNYQIDHMYIRYFLWNFVGRISDVQDAGVTFLSVSDADRQEFIAPTGDEGAYPIKFYALPFLLGLVGLIFHYRRDWQMALALTSLFLFLGVIATLQQNQQQPQPRERDYFYVGSFMVFAIWIGIGAASLADVAGRATKKDGDEEDAEPSAGVAGGVAALCLLAVPINMAIGGWHAHDRSNNWVPWDYAYNILQSMEKDAIVFTNGDNDTFPLWYLQDVAGVRRDVRVVNLSLGNGPWYIWQLKNERPWGALPVPISFHDKLLEIPEGTPGALDAEIDVPPPVVTIDIPRDVMKWATQGSADTVGRMSFTLRGMGGGGGNTIVRVQDKLIADILKTNGWKRPIYFSSSVGPNAFTGLEEYFRFEGMTYRVMPVKQRGAGQLSMNVDVMRRSMLKPLQGDDYSTEPQYGFRFRGLDDPSVYLLEDHRRTVLVYRQLYARLAAYELTSEKNSQGAIAALDALENAIPPDRFAMPYWIASTISQLYRQAGATAKADKYARRAIAAVDAMGESWTQDRFAATYNPIDVKAEMYASVGDYQKAIVTYDELQRQLAREGYGSDPNVRGKMEELRIEQHLVKKDTAAAVRELESIIAGYGGATDPALRNNAGAMRQRLLELTTRESRTEDGERRTEEK